MVRHLLLGIGITLMIFSLVLIKVDINSTELTRQDIVNEAKKLGMSFPGENYTRGISLDRGANLEKTLENITQEESEKKSSNFEKEQKNNENQGNDLQEEITLVISSGMKAREVANLLVEKGLLKEKETFIKLLEKFDVENKVMAGTYELKRGISNLELLLKLTVN